jgi:hypothetical protein
MHRASRALGAYLAIAVAATWPLVRGPGRDVAWDLGDSILNMWIVAWDCEQLKAIVSGDVGRIATFFDTNIFYPEPLTLAYSDHLIAQAIQIFPIYVASGNPILCYNLLFLSTIVLSGLGMYLLVRELTGHALAAFVAGLVFAFAPYRLAQSSHLQVLSSQWMPFVLYGLTRYFSTRRVRPLVGASAALVAQNLSSGYYLLFFAPFAALYALWDSWRHGLLRDRRTWMHLCVAGAGVAIVTAPFLLPYAAIRDEVSRTGFEVGRYSADVYSYATAFPEQRIWGRLMQAFPKGEGELFPGAVPLLLALIGILAWRESRAPYADPIGFAPQARLAPQEKSAPQVSSSRAPRWIIVVLVIAAILHATAAIVVLLIRRVTIDLGLFTLRMTDISQLLLRAAIAYGLALFLSPGLRSRTAAFMRSRGFFVLALLATAWLSLGPSPEALGRPINLASPYRLLFEYVPGFGGLRVPARFAMVGALMLAVLAGYGASVLARGRIGRVVLLALAAVFLLEATHVPFTVNAMTPTTRYNLPEPRLYRPARAPVIYKEVAQRAPGSVLVELPLGYADFDLRAMYYSLVHHRPLLNGYSGFFTVDYKRLELVVSELPRHPEVTLDALRARGATHAIVHESAFLGSEGPDTTAALVRLGAVELFREGPEILLILPAR